MLISRESQSPFSEVDASSIGVLFNIRGISPGFVEVNGESVLIAAGQIETQLFNGESFISLFSSEVDYYTQIEGGRYLETDPSNALDLEEGSRSIDLVVADFNNDGVDEIIYSYDESVPGVVSIIGDGVLRYYQLNEDEVYQTAAVDPFAEINQQSGSKYITALDANGDGFLDLVVNNSDRETPEIYLNTGNGDFELFTGETNLPSEFDLSNTNSIYSVDGDNDGDLDVVVRDDSDNLLFFPYQDGQYTQAAESENPFAGVEVSGELAFTDVDGDSDVDVLGISFGSGDVNYYENVSVVENNPPIAANDRFEVLGINPQELDVLFNDFSYQSSNFTISEFPETTALGGAITQRDNKLVYTAPTGITTLTEDTFEYTLTDAEGQTDTAIVTVSIFPQLFFQRTADDNLFAYLDAGSQATPDLADIDRDGDTDLISGNEDAEIEYFRNDDGLVFEQTGTDNPFSDIFLGEDLIDDSAVAFADYDDDGDLDFVAASERVRDDNEYFYFQNNDGFYTELFGDSNPVRNINEINSSHLTPVAVDWDNDGDADLAVGSSGSISYFQNDGGILQEVAEADNPFQEFNIAEEDSELDLGSDVSVNFFDFDDDADLDIITGNGIGQVFAFTNNGDSWTKLTGKNHPLGEDFDLEDDVTIGRGDADNDGDDDLIIGKANGTFLYWESLAIVNGTPPQNSILPEIDRNFSQSFIFQEAENNPFSSLDAGNDVSPELADIDRDGDLDLISGNGDAEIRYFLNDEGNFVPQDNPLTEIFSGDDFLIDDSAFAFADYDGDEDLDLVAVSEQVRDNGEYFYFRNDGGNYTQLFGEDNPVRTISDINSTLKPTAVDWDNDGDEDLVVGSAGFVRYFQNDGGILQEVIERENPFRFFNLVEDNNDAPLHLGSDVSLSFFDFDSDADLDLLAGNSFGEILAFQNDGNGWTPLTGENHPLGEDIDIDSVEKIAQGDVDNDGDRDFVVGSEDNFLYWEQQPNVLNTSINRFQNTDIPGTYLFAGEAESENIRENFPNFTEEGLAFEVAVEPGNDLIPLYRFQSIATPGTYLFAGETERENINQNFADSFNEEGLAFYVYSVGSGRGSTFYRFQNQDRSGTYLFAGEAERENILANFPNFIEEGAAFEVGT